ncbi:response regulator transcription factor [Amycolatopsis sp. NBC_01307]|uniref:response regulator transcription factor n=1 Tax=Amycolatopsis sp. NBC_01307 TaxID=2903561 RepID=UPI002E12C239|nr:response regulator transcription factor [Amycolatopsis sp. NBC_01307]
MAVIGRPDVPEGAHRRLVDALHEVYLRAGAPGVRTIAQRGGVSRDTAHRVLTNPALPTWPALEAVVAALGGDIGRFRALWVAARQPDAAPVAEPPAEPGAAAGPSVRVLVVEDHPLYRQALVQAVGAFGHVVVGTAANGEDAVSLALETRPEVILMDHFLPGLLGIDATARIRSADPAIRVLIISAGATGELTLAALRSGAHGVLSKDVEADGIDRAIRAVARGEVHVPAGAAAPPEVAEPREAGEQELKPRERRVLQLVAEGYTDVQIAERLAVSVRTVRSYLDRVRDKTGERRRAGLVRVALESGLVRPRPGGATPDASSG